jgi:hypothetical protein
MTLHADHSFAHMIDPICMLDYCGVLLYMTVSKELRKPFSLIITSYYLTQNEVAVPTLESTQRTSREEGARWKG